MRSNKKLVADILLIGVLLLVALGSLLYMKLSEQQGAYVVIHVDGKQVATYSLEEEGTFPLNGGTNILVIKDGEAFLIDADCPDKLCVNQGKISKGGQVITCLPNKLTVTVISDDKDVDFLN